MLGGLQRRQIAMSAIPARDDQLERRVAKLEVRLQSIEDERNREAEEKRRRIHDSYVRWDMALKLLVILTVVLTIGLNFAPRFLKR
jgi:hypothetical protein